MVGWLLLFLAAIWPATSYAVACTKYRYAGTYTTSWQDSASAAAGEWWGLARAAGQYQDANITQSFCGSTSGNNVTAAYSYAVDGTNTMRVTKVTSGNCGSTPVNSSTVVATNNVQTQAGDCAPSCPTGVSTVRNITTGWNGGAADSSTIEFLPSGAKAPSGYFGPLTPGYSAGSFCIDQCLYNVGSAAEQVAAGSGWKEYSATTPSASGMYRQSADMKFNSVGSACSPGNSENDKALSPTLTAPSCDGAVGQMTDPKTGKAKTVCVPRLAGDRNIVPRTTTAQVVTGNPKAGTVNTDGTRTTGTGGASGSSSADDGRVTTGTGGTFYVPGTAPTGTTTVGSGTAAREEQQACGAPGQPKCAIEVDLGETPQGITPTNTVDLTYTPDGSVNLGAGSCPAPFTWTDRLGSHALDLTRYCNLVSSVIKPLVLLAAALAAYFIIGGFARGDS